MISIISLIEVQIICYIYYRLYVNWLSTVPKPSLNEAEHDLIFLEDK